MRILKSLMLTLVLSGATYAGEMAQPFAPPAPSPETSTQQTTAGEMPQLAPSPSSATITQQATQDAVTEMLMFMIQSIL
jgi:hypothetical protein